MRGADLVAGTLAAAGTARLFTLSGNQIMPVFDSCIDAGIDLVHVRQEAAAVHMADAWGRLTGEPGVALGHRRSGVRQHTLGPVRRDDGRIAHGPA